MTPEAAAVLADLDAHGVRVRADGGRLRFWPADRMYPTLRRRLREHREELLAALGGGLADATEAPGEPPPRPADRAGFVTELTFKGGVWAWRHRRADVADLAWLAYQQKV